MSGSVREVIGRRLKSLSVECLRVLEGAAVLGREFELPQLQAVTKEEVAADPLLRSLDEADQTGFIESLGDDKCRFTHTLVHEVFLQSLGKEGRARLHGKVGDALEDFYASHAEIHAAELPRHFLLAEPCAEQATIAKYAAAAGAQALSKYAYETAAEYLDLALRRSDGSAPYVIARIQLNFAKSVAGMSSYFADNESVEHLCAAFDSLHELGLLDEAVDAALTPFFTVSMHNASVVDVNRISTMLRKAIDLCPQNDLRRGRLHSHLAYYRYIETRNAGESRALIEEGRRYGQIDSATEFEGLILLARILTWDSTENPRPERGNFSLYEEIEDLYLDALALAERRDTDALRAYACIWLAKLYVLLGRLEDGRRCTLQTMNLARRIKDRYWMEQARDALASLACIEGDWGTALENLDSADESLRSRKMSPTIRGRYVTLHFMKGDREDAMIQLELLKDGDKTDGSEITRLSIFARDAANGAWYLDDWSRIAEAESFARNYLRSQDREPFARNRCKECLAVLAILRNDRKEAARAYVEMSPGPPRMYFRLGLAMLASTAGHFDRSCKLFDDALLIFRKGYRPSHGWACFEYAKVLYRRKPEKYRARAKALLQKGLEVAGSIGMKVLVERITKLIAEISNS